MSATVSKILLSNTVNGIPRTFALSWIIFQLSALYPGFITRKTSSKFAFPCFLSSWKSFAISIESFPPEIQTAILSPSFTSSYSRIAFVNLHQTDLRNFLIILFSISFCFSAMTVSFSTKRPSIIRRKERYPPSILYASYPASSSIFTV